MIAIYFGIPGLLALLVDPEQRAAPIARTLGVGFLFDAGFPINRLLLPTLLTYTIAIFVWLALDKSFKKTKLWNYAGFCREYARIAALFLPAAAFTLLAAYLLSVHTILLTATDSDGQTESRFLYLPINAPHILIFIAIGYPIFSAYPQEVTHRVFFFHRYRPIMPNAAVLITINAIAFSWLHAPFWNLPALIMTLPAGVIFAVTYLRSNSGLAAGFEHAIYGWWVFFTGLGWFVFAGSIGR